MKNRILPWLGCVAIALMILVSGCSRERSEKAAELQVRQMAEAAAMVLNTQMNERVTDTLLCAATCERCRESFSVPEAREEANQTLEKWLKISGTFEAILLVDKSGVCVASAPSGLAGKDFSNDEAFKGAITGKTALSEFHKSDLVDSLNPKSEGWTLSIAAPVVLENAVSGVIISYVKWSHLNKLIGSFIVGQTGGIFVLDRKAQIIMHRDTHLYGISTGDHRVNIHEIDNAVRSRAPYVRYEYKYGPTGRPEPKLVGFFYPGYYGNFPGLGWTVAASVSEIELGGSSSPWARLFR
jgi:hypothetical protein